MLICYIFGDMKITKINHKLLKYIIIFFFIAITFFLARKIKIGISPDELYHFYVSKAFSTTLTIPENTPDTFVYQDITKISYLYFWINGRVLNLNIFNIDELLLLRIVSIFYSVFTLVFTYLLSREVIKKKGLQIIPVILLSNTLMFVFLSGMVNYDNLLNLFAVLSIFALVKLFKNPKKLKFLYLWIVFVSLGTLTKFTMLPLTFIEFLIIGYLIFKKRIKLDFKTKKNIIFLALALITTIPPIFLYGSNIIQYGTLTPSCDQIMKVEQCLVSPLFRRNYNMTDNLDLVSLGGIKEAIITRLSPLEYFFRWIFLMAQRVYGIMGHRALYLPSFFYSVYVLIAFLFVFSLIKNWEKVKALDTILLIILGFYTMILAFVQNYVTYLETGLLDLALQGRYIFPVMSIYYALLIRNFEFILNKKLARLFLILLLIVFVIGCFPPFLLKINQDWLS